MPQVMLDLGDQLVVNETEVGRGARHPNMIEDIQLVRFYLDVSDQARTPPSGTFDTTGINGMTEEPKLANRILQWQIKDARFVNASGFTYEVADGKVSVPHTVSDGTIGYGGGKKHGVYAIRQMARRWELYKAAHNAGDDFKISDHPLCGVMLRTKLLQMGQ